MLKRFGNGSSGLEKFEAENADPMSGVSNLADAMLVLAVGIMLALIINWKIDVSHGAADTVTQVEQEDMTEITDYDSVNEDDLSEILDENGLEEKGKVYVDPETGKMYVAMPEDE